MTMAELCALQAERDELLRAYVMGATFVKERLDKVRDLIDAQVELDLEGIFGTRLGDE